MNRQYLAEDIVSMFWWLDWFKRGSSADAAEVVQFQSMICQIYGDC